MYNKSKRKWLVHRCTSLKKRKSNRSLNMEKMTMNNYKLLATTKVNLMSADLSFRWVKPRIAWRKFIITTLIHIFSREDISKHSIRLTKESLHSNPLFYLWKISDSSKSYSLSIKSSYFLKNTPTLGSTWQAKILFSLSMNSLTRKKPKISSTFNKLESNII